MIAVIDFGAGNLSSVKKALEFLGADYAVTRNADEVLKADKIIFPGVGNFGDAMSQLKKSNLIKPIKKIIADGKPFLGICLGMQLLFEESEESKGVKGLGVFKGKVKKIPSKMMIDEPNLTFEQITTRKNLKGLKIRKIPQIGWNNIKIKKGKLFEGIKSKPFVYFVHSYYAEPQDNSIIATTTDYGIEFASAVEKGNVFAVQFHPEKSGDVGIKILENFLRC